ncbi:MAG: hypothetical protein WA667_02850 [Candidatus Nitrosopolaris sp.]
MEADGERGPLEDNDIKSKSKTTQAIKLFSELNAKKTMALFGFSFPITIKELCA